MASRGDGTYGRHSVLDGTGVVRPAPRTPARLAGWARREAVLVPGRGVGGTGLAARTAREPSRGRRPRASGGGGGGGLRGRGSVGSALAVKQAGDRAVAEHLVDRPGQQRRDGQHGELVEPLLLRHRQRVRDDDLADPGVLQDVYGPAGQHAVGGGGDNPVRPLLE